MAGDRSPQILQVSTADKGGGAERVAWNLFQAYGLRGHASWLAVGFKRGETPGVFGLPHHSPKRTRWADCWRKASRGFQQIDRWVWGVPRLTSLARRLAGIGKAYNLRRGIEDFDFPGTWRLLELPPERPDILHCHNLHGGYFDLRVLPWLSRQVPVVLTLHDAWLLGGHCAHSLGCERWKTGCGECPDLSVYPAVQRDATAANWRRKQRIFSKCLVSVTTPSHWLMNRLRQSMLAPAVWKARVIPSGVDLSVFRPADRRSARVAVGLPGDATVLLFAAKGVRRNPWKDYETIREAVDVLTRQWSGRSVVFVALGEQAPPERIGETEIRFEPFERDLLKVAAYYQSADVYLHAAKADTFPNAVLEALACGTPVVATAVGGIPEQVKGLWPGDSNLPAQCRELNGYGPDEATGMLVPPGEGRMMALAIEALLAEEAIFQRVCRNAAADARTRFGLERQVDDYLEWYDEIITDRSELTCAARV